MDTSAIGASTASPDPQQSSGDKILGDLELGDFIDLMIEELRNQDPLNPLDNTEILQQVSQIREISATTQLNDTLDAVLLGQNISSASNMIGKQIRALATNGNEIQGVVDRVSIAGGVAKVHVGEYEISLKNIREILPTAPAETPPEDVEEPIDEGPVVVVDDESEVPVEDGL